MIRKTKTQELNYLIDQANLQPLSKMSASLSPGSKWFVNQWERTINRLQLYHWALALCYDAETQSKAFIVNHERRLA